MKANTDNLNYMQFIKKQLLAVSIVFLWDGIVFETLPVPVTVLLTPAKEQFLSCTSVFVGKHYVQLKSLVSQDEKRTIVTVEQKTKPGRKTRLKPAFGYSK